MGREVILICAALLTGCASQVEYRYTKIDVPPKLERCPITALNIEPGTDAGSVIQAHRTDIKCLQTSVKKYEVIIDSLHAKDIK